MTDRRLGHRSRRGEGRRQPIEAFLLLVAILVAGIFFAGPAHAHASLRSSDPADGSIVTSAPAHIVLTFSEPVSITAMRLVDADGAGVDLTDARAENETVTIVAPPIAQGTHALSWRVISADGHPVGGTVIFSVGVATAPGIALETASPWVLTLLVWSARLLLYVAIFVGIGGMVFAAWIGDGSPLPFPAGPTIAAICALGLVAALISLGLQGLDMLGADFPRLVDPATWREGLSTSYAATLALDGTGLGLALASAWLPGRALRRGATAIALLAIGAAFAVSGHVSTASPQGLTRTAIFIHGVCLVLWLGALLPLGALLRTNGGSATVALRRFSRMVPYPVALIVVSGLVMAVIQLESPSALWTTPYGRIFDAKIAAVLLLLTLGAWNRYGLTQRTIAGEAAPRRAMVRSITVEMVLAAAILGLVASWRFTPPPRALGVESVAAAAVPIHLHILGQQAMADLVIAPGRAGPSSIAIAVLDGHFGQLDAKGVTVTLTNPAAGLEPIVRDARHLEGANWTIDLQTIPAPGQWTVRVRILVTDFTEVTLDQPFDLPR